MALQFSGAVRDARLDSVESTAGATAKVRILTGTAPANCAAAETGTLLCEITLPADWMNAASGGSKTKLGTWQGTGAAGGTAGYFRLVDNAGTTCHIQGTVTATSGGGDMELDNTSIANGQTVTITTFTLNDGNA